MGLFDSIKSAVTEAVGSMSASALPEVIEKVYPGGLSAVLQQLQQSGYGEQVNSWLGHGPNEPITADALRNALNNDYVRQLAEKFGIPTDQVLETLSNVLPQAIDKQSPNGQLEPPTV